MELFEEGSDVAPELYFLIAKFLARGPLKHTAQTLIKELESEQVLPRRLDWQGREHTQTLEELERHYPEISCTRLLRVCLRALHMSAAHVTPANTRLSLLGAAVAGDNVHTNRHNNIVHRVVSRESGRNGCKCILPTAMLGAMQLQRRTLGHLSAVYCVVYDTSGKYILTGADDFLLKQWSVLDCTLRRTYRGAAAEITDVSISGDNVYVAAGCVDRSVRLWCMRTGAAIGVLNAHAGTVTAVAWRPWTGGEHVLATSSTDGSVAFWTCINDTWTCRRMLERTRPGACHMVCATWSAGGLYLAAGSADYRVRLYRMDDDICRDLEIEAHGDAVDSIRWAHTSIRFVSGSKDGTAALWSYKCGRWRHKLLLRPDNKQKLKVTMVCWDCTDQYIFIAVSDATIEMWCSMTGAMRRSLRGHNDEVYVLEPHPHYAGVLLSAGHDGRLHVWDINRETPLLVAHTNHVEPNGEIGAIFDAKWSPDGVRIAATDSHGHLIMFGIGRGHDVLRTLPQQVFFHTDYRPISRDLTGLPLDELTGLPPHVLPPPFLVDVDGAPLPHEYQRLVPGRHLTNGVGLLDGDYEWYEATPSLLIAPLGSAHLEGIRLRGEGMLHSELEQYKRELRRRPHMIVTQHTQRPRNNAKRKTATRSPRVVHRVTPELDSATPSDSDSSIRLSSTDTDSSDDNSSISGKSADDANSSSSDWEAPRTRQTRPTRRRRRRSSPPRAPRALATPTEPPAPPLAPLDVLPSTPPMPAAQLTLAGDWLTSVFPRKSPYQPQIGDECVYFRVGHERYFEAVEEKQVYKVHPRDKPWTRGVIPACALVRVSGIKFSLRPVRVASLRLVVAGGRAFTAKYHDMADVIDFLVLTQHYHTALQRKWSPGDRFRCVIDECWWRGEVVENCGSHEGCAEGDVNWELCASHYLSILVKWDNGEHDRLSPWDLEPLPPDGSPAQQDAVPLKVGELDGPAYVPLEGEWPHGDRAEAATQLSNLVAQVMSLSAAECFSTPVDPSVDRRYATLVHYPIDLATIRARFSNLYYRRMAAAEFDIEYISVNAELLSQDGGDAELLKKATLITNVLKHAIREHNNCDVMQIYRKYAKNNTWMDRCKNILREVWSSSDAEPFRAPVSPSLAPDYCAIVRRPCDLGLVANRLKDNHYNNMEHFAADMRLIFSNSRLYNTNRRSRIYTMTARLSDLFETLYKRHYIKHNLINNISSDDDETLANTSRRQRNRVSNRRSTRRRSPQPGTSKQYNNTHMYESDSEPRGRKRRKHVSSHSSTDIYIPTNNGLYNKHKKRRRRRSRESSTCSSSTSSDASDVVALADVVVNSSRRYSSDHEYKPTYSTDDDQPLNRLREQSEQSTSTSRRQRPAVRAPRNGVSYNEDSEEENKAAIAKRERHATTLPQRRPAEVASAFRLSDHTYHNGHATTTTTAAAAAAAAARRIRTERASSSSSSNSPLSVSQRGRVRRLTAKARRMLRE